MKKNKMTKLIIDGIKTNYSIDIYGNIENDITGNYISKRVSNAGYYQVHLSINGKSKHYNVHRLVAKTFIPNPENKLTVNHIDGNKLNNFIENLEWATHKEQNAHYIKNNLSNNIGETSYRARITNKDAHKICKLLEKGKNIRSISKKLNIDSMIIFHILHKGSWKQISDLYDIDINKISKTNDDGSHHNSKLTKMEVFKILELHNNGKSNREIESLLNNKVSHKHIGDICRGNRQKRFYNEYYNLRKESSTTIESPNKDEYRYDIIIEFRDK